MKRLLVAMLAATLIMFGSANASAQGKPDDSAASFVGRWNVVKDFNGDVDTPFDGTAWWELRADGTFVDNMGETGAWSASGDRFTLQYGAGGRTVFTGRLISDMVLGTMHNLDSSYTGIFAMRQ